MKIAIVGAGIAGLSSAWALVKRGHQVTVLEQGPVPNPLAASGDHHRIIRRAYGAAAGYARLITQAYEAWDEMWADLGRSHLDPRGFFGVSREEGDDAQKFRKGSRRAATRLKCWNRRLRWSAGRSSSRGHSATPSFQERAARCIAGRSRPTLRHG